MQAAVGSHCLDCAKAARPDVKTKVKFWNAKQPTLVTFAIEPMGEVVKFTITHHDYEKANAGIDTGWPVVVAGLKTLLETGKPLNLPTSM